MSTATSAPPGVQTHRWNPCAAVTGLTVAAWIARVGPPVPPHPFPWLQRWLSELPEPVERPWLEPKPAPVGTLVDWSTVRLPPRKWPEPPRPVGVFEVEPIPEPLTPWRDARPEEIPTNARLSAGLARAAEREVRITYAQGGQMRTGEPRGVCPACRTAQLMYVEDGAVREHNEPTEKCPGEAYAPEGNDRRRCLRCGAVGRALKADRMPAHDRPTRPCPGGRQAPDELLAPEELAPLRSLVVRVKDLGVALWEDGGFTAAWLFAPGGGVVEVSANDWKGACRDGASGEGLPDAGVPEGGDVRDALS